VKEQYAAILEEGLLQYKNSEHESKEEEWKICKEVINMVAEEVIGRETPQKRNHWFNAERESATKAKNEAYQMMHQKHGTRSAVTNHQGKRKIEKKVHCKKKQECEKKQLEELQGLHSARESWKFYQKINSSWKEFKPRVTLCRSKDGSIISNQQGILKQ
jgi:predicted ATPase